MKNKITAFIASLAESEPQNKTKGEAWKEKRFTKLGYSFWLNASPVRMYPGYSLPDEVTLADKSRCLTCAYWLEKETNMICHKVNGVNKPLLVKQLAKRLEISERQCYRFVKRMCELRVMSKEKGRLYLNPVYFFRGKHISYHLYSLFKNELAIVLPPWVIDKYEGRKNTAVSEANTQKQRNPFFS